MENLKVFLAILLIVLAQGRHHNRHHTQDVEDDADMFDDKPGSFDNDDFPVFDDNVEEKDDGDEGDAEDEEGKFGFRKDSDVADIDSLFEKQLKVDDRTNATNGSNTTMKPVTRPRFTRMPGSTPPRPTRRGTTRPRYSSRPRTTRFRPSSRPRTTRRFRPSSRPRTTRPRTTPKGTDFYKAIDKLIRNIRYLNRRNKYMRRTVWVLKKRFNSFRRMVLRKIGKLEEEHESFGSFEHEHGFGNELRDTKQRKSLKH